MREHELTPSTIVAFAAALMLPVQTMLRGRGGEKKILVILVLKKCITLKSFENEDDRRVLLSLCDTLVPVSIDAIKGAKDLFVQQKSCC
jgi:hypothetical protein